MLYTFFWAFEQIPIEVSLSSFHVVVIDFFALV